MDFDNRPVLTTFKPVMRRIAATLAFLISFSGMVQGAVKSIDIAPVWAGHPVGFCLLTRGNQQFVAFYDAERQMTLAQRELGQETWKFKKLPSRVEWDSHNYITMDFDRDGFLHVSGNMHRSKLVYFRSSKALDIESVEPVSEMTGELENEMTYPVFLKGSAGEMIFSYRDGRSGDGETIYNLYDEKNRSWRRLLDTPLFDGEGKMSAYPLGPKKGPDGWFHLSWVWRDTSQAETNHDLGYAKSRDFVRWETASGEPVDLPIRPGSPGVTVDPIPVNGGILNGSGKVGFDLTGKPVLAYHKFDENGATQLYFARFENRSWNIHKATDWSYRWEISGGGSLKAAVSHGEVSAADGVLSIPVSHVSHGSGTYEIDPERWILKGKIIRPDGQPAIPSDLRKVSSEFPGIQVKWSSDSGNAPDATRYRLRWETLGPNRDKPRPLPWPEPVMLKLIEISAN